MTMIAADPHLRIELSYGYANRPCRSTPPCGDGAAWIPSETISWLLVLDAIGHGPIAHRIARLLLSTFSEIVQSSTDRAILIDELVEHLHATLINRRLDEQAAISLYRFDHAKRSAEMLAIGNLETYVIKPQGMMILNSQNGMVGGRIPKTLHKQSIALSDNTVLAVFSDGINSREFRDGLGKYVYGPFSKRELPETARILVQSFHRDYDDASCALVRVRRISP